MSAPAANRHAFIDHLRVFATLLVILHHTAIVYGGSGGWYWREFPNGSNRLLILFNAVNQSWFMGFFFLLAGYYTPASFDRKGPRRYLADRFLRLGVPLAVYFLFVSTFTIALARTATGHELWPGWWQMIELREFEPGPLWFAEALLLFALAYAAWRRWVAPVQPAWTDLPAPRTLFLAALATGGVAYAVRFVVPVGRNVAWLQLGYFPAYVLLFAAGCWAAKGRILERVALAQAQPWAGLSAFLFCALPVVMLLNGGAGGFDGGWHFNAFFYALWDPLICWGIILYLLWSCRTYLPGTGPLPAFLARHAFAAYIVHPPIVVGLSLLARGWSLPPLLKFGVIGGAACAGAFAAAGLLLLVPGVKKVL